MKLNRVEPNLDAALYWPVNQKVFLFKGSGYWQWDELTRTDLSRYPKPIKELFTGVPDQPSAAMSWQDGQVYFFKGKEYWRLNQQLRVAKGYPRNTTHWMHCSPRTPDTNSLTGDVTTPATVESVLDVPSATDAASLSSSANVTLLGA